MSDRPVRVRIGPSPTGEPHVGTAYIALFNLAFAKKNGGKFVLRIEDTDQVRSKKAWEDEIFAGLHWLGLSWDEGPDVGGPFGPYRQSERTAVYREHAQMLLDKGAAYRCFCTPEELVELRKAQKDALRSPWRDKSPAEVEAALASGQPHTIRLAMPLEGKIVFKDGLRGEIAKDAKEVDDQILMKSDGYPTYHLANVVDDHLMEISHVIRAEEWISSTPKHVVLYDAFGWDRPEFIHMPLLRNKDQTKISKRKNPVSLLDYKSRGFIPKAVLNYLARLGWSMPDEREKFTFEEFVDNFTWDRMSLGGPVFDIEKLTWLNGKYYREDLNDAEWVQLLRTELFDEAYLSRIVPLLRERIETSEEFVPAAAYFFAGDVQYPAELLLKKAKKRSFKELREALEKFAEEIDAQLDFSHTALEELGRSFAEREGWKPGEIFMAIRVAVTGRDNTPGLFDVMSVLGRAKVRRRIRNAIEVCRSVAEPANQQKAKES